MFNIKKIDSNQDITYYETLASTFPKAERYSIETLRKCPDISIYSIEDETPIGYLAICEDEELAYLFYLCIDKNYQSQGYGSKALDWLKENYPMQIALDVEKVERSTPYESDKVKRRRFYLKNHFHLAHIALSFLDVEFQVMCNKQDLSIKRLKHTLSKLEMIGYTPTLTVLEKQD